MARNQSLCHNAQKLILLIISLVFIVYLIPIKMMMNNLQSIQEIPANYLLNGYVGYYGNNMNNNKSLCSLGMDLPSQYAESIAFINKTLRAINRSWFASYGHTLNALRVGSPIVKLSDIMGSLATDNDFDLHLITHSAEDWQQIRRKVCDTINNRTEGELHCGFAEQWGIPRIKIWRLGLPEKMMLSTLNTKRSYCEIFPMYIINETHIDEFGFDRIHPKEHILPLRKIKYGQFELYVKNTRNSKYNFVDSYTGKYGYGCHQIVYANILWNEHHIDVQQLNEYGKQHGLTMQNKEIFIREIEKKLFQCAENLHHAGYASFYQCYNEHINEEHLNRNK